MLGYATGTYVLGVNANKTAIVTHAQKSAQRLNPEHNVQCWLHGAEIDLYRCIHRSKLKVPYIFYILRKYNVHWYVTELYTCIEK